MTKKRLEEIEKQLVEAEKKPYTGFSLSSKMQEWIKKNKGITLSKYNSERS